MPANSLPADPVFGPEHWGWGLDYQTDSVKYAREERLQENLPIVCEARDAVGASAMLPQIEAKVRAAFKFDQGWDCMHVSRIVYGLGPGETLMVNQSHGNCVGNSHDCLLADRIAHELFCLGEPEEPLGKGQLAIPFIPYSYGVGRLVGGMLGPGDGSYCGAQIEGTMKHGFLPCFVDGLQQYAGALPQCTAAVGKLFGRSRSEIEKWMPEAAAYDLLEAPKCRSAADVWMLLVEKQVPLQICSGIMPTFWKDDPVYGPLYRMGQRASHSTQIVGAFEFKGQRFSIHRNQWGYGAHKGNKNFDIPGGCMVMPLEEMDTWFRRGAECIGIGAIQGLGVDPGA